MNLLEIFLNPHLTHICTFSPKVKGNQRRQFAFKEKSFTTKELAQMCYLNHLKKIVTYHFLSRFLSTSTFLVSLIIVLLHMSIIEQIPTMIHKCYIYRPCKRLINEYGTRKERGAERRDD